MFSAIGILLGFTVLAVLLAFKKPVWLALLASSVVMGVVGDGPGQLLNIVVETLQSSIAVDLVVVTFLIAVFVNLYRSSGFLARLGDELVKLLGRPRLITMFVPAVLGLLPVAGGALMSAPIVDTVGNHIGLSKRQRLFINVWFRHVIFLVYPLSMVLITAATLAGVDLWDVIIRQLPVAATMVLAGYVLGFRGAGRDRGGFGGRADRAVLARVFSPMLLAIALAVSTRPFLDRQLLEVVPLTRYSMVLGLSLAITLLITFSKSSLRSLVDAVGSRTTLELVAAAFSAILLRNVFVGVGGPEILSHVVPTDGGAGTVLFLIAVPFAISLATGNSMTGNVVSISVFQALLGLGVREVSLIYSSAMVGYLASPAHLCYVYTAQYFQVPLSAAYREMFTSSFLALATAVGIYFLWPL
ncbi:MAG: hypothetical protein DRO39_09810 [Thermoprotei archaeon]|nr:MAG: hypothetical protein DRO39_09810 [Thermoprotei archaeon]